MKTEDLQLRADGQPSDAELFVNRELSFLAFNARIVQEAADPSVPLLERLKFVSIVGQNLDEFFMVRVAGLQQQLKSGVLETGPDGMLPSEQLAAIAQRVKQQLVETEEVLLSQLQPGLAEAGVVFGRVAELPADAQKQLRLRFEEEIFPMLTPLAVDSGHPFPFLKNRRIALAVELLPPGAEADSVPLMAVVQVPSLLPRFYPLQLGAERVVIWVEDLIRANVDELFPAMEILSCEPFRVLRNWDLSFDEEEQEDLLEAVQKELQSRWRLDAVRLEVGAEAGAELVERLRRLLRLRSEDVARRRGPLALTDLSKLVDLLHHSELRDPPFKPVRAPTLKNADIFEQIADGDVLLHHPYESYEPVLELLERAADDPAVLAIKQTLYRVNRSSPILQTLIRAADNGKQVTALVELKARFGEEVAVEWAQALEQAGVQVVYGMVGLKTTCKVTLVVRREPSEVRRYVHLGTGNYNEATARVYSDLSFFTARADVGEDVSALFNLLTGYSEPPAWRQLVVAPLSLRQRILKEIKRAMEAVAADQPAKIVIKTNSLVDTRTARALCRAAQAGVEVILLVRGPCALRVGLPGFSDRVRVRMIVDRFLEHSRVLYFQCGEEARVFITSTDIMPRNFDRRLEVMLPIEEPELKRRIVDEILATELADDVKATELGPDGAYHRVPGPAEGVEPTRAQACFIRLARARSESPLPSDGKRGGRRLTSGGEAH